MSEDHPTGCRCDHHVFSTVVGFGLRVVPRAPFRIRLGPDTGTLDVEHDAADGERFARLMPEGHGGYRSKINQNTPSLLDVLDVETGPVPAHEWHVEAPGLRFPLPAGFCLHSVPAGSSSPFDLCGPCDTLVYGQQPTQVPEINDMVGPGQRETRRGQDWIEVEYERQGSRWWQRHEVVEGSVVFTGQAPAQHADEARDALGTILDRLCTR